MRRLWRASRCVGYACTLLLLVMFAVSFRQNHTIKKNAIYLYNGRVLLMVYSSPPSDLGDQALSVDEYYHPTLHFDSFDVHDLYTTMLLDLEPRQMWSWPEVGLSTGSERLREDLPLIYPLLAGLAISARLLVVSRRMKRGPTDCRRCGYSLVGIESDSYPECGVERA